MQSTKKRASINYRGMSHLWGHGLSLTGSNSAVAALSCYLTGLHCQTTIIPNVSCLGTLSYMRQLWCYN